MHSTQLTPFTFDEVRSEHEQTIVKDPPSIIIGGGGGGGHSIVLLAVCDTFCFTLMDIDDARKHSDVGVLGRLWKQM